ncbi:hypothetical protein [Alteromonas oceanisediminis]|uniref:hypothetical protein n=1 Tax=Alteromonas oceanisediminis TaxID=2836180 RepID=UPI001BDAE28F|nr:hypothetical protein [Alteromonas oceanisediminis]MBT0585883.1 hypothetical protein [Alteromonas oceanisediminis]
MKIRWLLLLLMLTSAGIQAQSITLNYQSRYVTEGRDNLGDGGIAWMIAELPTLPYDAAENLTFTAEYGVATADSIDYDELIITAAYAGEVGQFSYRMGASRLEFLNDSVFDNELFVNVSTALTHGIRTTLEAIYSTEQDGTFVLFSNERPFAVNRQFTVTPYIAIGFDYGYASKRYDGYNHISLGAATDFSITEKSTVNLSYQWDIRGSDIRNTVADARDQHWLSLGYSYAF